MSLTVVATPIGNYLDITLRAIETLKSCDAIICEELKPARVLLKRIGIEPSSKLLYQLNEHSKTPELPEYLNLCREKNIALISDCGTPGFCDPGSQLVNLCMLEKIKVDVNPGASSLMTLLSIAGTDLNEFYFVGFLPAEKIARNLKISDLKKIRKPLVIMDTPYRLKATLQDFALASPNSQAILGIDLTGENHKVLRGKMTQLSSLELSKAPFVLILFPL
jgi:16S rRNA (cytidine1402-2'-O)-methyltransferase